MLPVLDILAGNFGAADSSARVCAFFAGEVGHMSSLIESLLRLFLSRGGTIDRREMDE